ncbi:MAG TPA: hypothetical protein VGS41_14300, partial [Chthonomonadales bacterium]|nr:hypothetical protein [Chthonomonadales bacterium]
LERKMQAAGITDVLDFTLNDALIIQQLLRLSEKAPPIKIGTELTGKTGLPTLPGNETINIGIRETGSVAGSISQLLALAAASTKAADAAKYAYAAQVAMAAGEKLSGDAAGGGRGKIGAFGAAAAAAGGNFGFLTNKVTLFAGAFGKIPLLGVIPLWHILVTTIADLLAVIIPASIALATFGAAAVPTVQNLYHQMANVLTVSGAIGKTIPPMTGGFQAMANAVQPEVYSIFGAALAVINSKATEFQQIATGAGAVLDQLASRAQLALGSSGMSKFLKNAVADLQGLGTALGNIFGIIGNLLKSMPGYAEILLRVLDGVTSALEAVTASPIVQGLIKLGLGFHGAAIYVGLLVTGLAFLAPWMARFAGWAVGVNSTATATARLSANASRLDKTKAAFADLGTALSGSSISVGKFAGAAERGNNALVRIGLAAARLASNPWTWAAAAAVVIGILAFKIFTAKDATQQWLESLQNTINNQQSLIGALGSMQSVVGTVSVAYKGAQTSVKNLSNSMTTFGASQF